MSNALARVFASRLEIQLGEIRKGADGLRYEFGNHLSLIQEITEIETWFVRKEDQSKIAFTEAAQDALGNWFVAIGKSYAEARQMLRTMRKFLAPKGAPNKRPDTLKMMDARIANGWSYKTLAAKMCDCGASEHTEHCEERIRKRLKELERFLAKYNITFRSS